MFIMIYFPSILFEVFMPCYFGSVVLEQSKCLTTDIYTSNWIDKNDKFKRNLMITVERTFRPITTFVAGLFGLNLSTFIRVSETLRFL